MVLDFVSNKLFNFINANLLGHNHGLLQVVNRPQWFTVQGSSRVYVDKVLAQLDDVQVLETHPDACSMS